jgi:arylsulfate sulfotransferase
MALGVLALMLSGCGSSGASPAAATANAPMTGGSSSQPFNPHSEAALSSLQLVRSDAAAPFIEWLTLHLNSTANLVSVEFNIQPKAGSVSAPVDVSYSNSGLIERGYMSTEGTTLTLPIFALYAGYTNQVTLKFSFQDGSTRSLITNITTADYIDPTGIYQNPTILKQRAAGSSLGFNFFVMKSELGSPVIVDTDGEVRWALPGTVWDSLSTALVNDQFVIGNAGAPSVYQLRLDGTLTQNSLTSPSITYFHHNIDHGNTGLLAAVNTQTNGVQNIESNVIEMTAQGSIFNHWDLGAIISSYMQSMGDDAADFVRPGVDWFHNNAAAYDSTDDSVIISSRENFVIKLDYHTGNIIWILGDPTKYWYTFPSLRAKALTVTSGGLYPIGQHAVSITPDGHLLLFNDGLGSLNQPVGQPAGETRSFSAVSAYSIDTATMTATNVWNYEDGQTIYSEICSSAYFGQQESLLIDYAVADNQTHAQLVGLDSKHQVAFAFQYPTTGCDTSWNAVPIYLESFAVN